MGAKYVNYIEGRVDKDGNFIDSIFTIDAKVNANVNVVFIDSFLKDHGESKTLSYFEYNTLMADYRSLCRKLDTDAPSSSAGLFKLWEYGDASENLFKKLIYSLGYRVLAPVYPKLHEYKLKKSGLSRLDELETLIKK